MTPADAAAEVRQGLPQAKRLHEQAKTIGSTTIEAIRSVGFDVIPQPSQALPNHHRIIHADGVPGFGEETLAQLASVFTNTTGH